MVTISIHRASRRYGIAIAAMPGSLRRETAVFGPGAAQEGCTNQKTGRTL